MARKGRNGRQPGGGDNASAGALLLGLIEEIERHREAKRAAGDDEKAVFARAKQAGFDTATIRQILKDRQLSAEEREEREALLQTYRASLGMLGGTPLGEAARRRFERAMKKPGEDEEAGQGGEDADGFYDAAKPSGPTPEELLAARAQGAAAAKAGKKIGENPFGADDARRAAWDEGWCAEARSDGMDIPPAFARTKKPKKDGEGDGAGGAGGKGH